MKKYLSSVRTMLWISVIAFFVVLTPMHTVHAVLPPWPDFVGQQYKEFLEITRENLRDTIAARAKAVAIQQVMKTIENSLNNGGSPRIITNYNDFLYGNIQDNAKDLVINDFLTTSLRGRVGGDYFPVGLSDVGVEKSYYDLLYGAVGAELESNPTAGAERIDAVADYCNFDENGNIIDAQQGAKFSSCLLAVSSANPIGEAISARERYDAQVAQEQNVAALTAVSSGVLPGFDDQNNIATPSVVVAELQKSKVYVPLNALTSGDTKQFTTIASSFVSKMILNTLTKELLPG